MTMQSGSNAKRSVGFLLGMCVVMLGANFIWTSYNSILLPTMVEKAAPEHKGLIVGLIAFLASWWASRSISCPVSSVTT